MENLMKKLSELEIEKDYYRQVAERLGQKALADAQDYAQMIRELRQREIKLQQSQEKLEQIIEERTAELVTRNKELGESTLRYDNLVKRIPHGVYTLRVRDTGSMQFEYLSPPLCQILDIDPKEMQQNASLAFSIAHPDDRESLGNSTCEATERRIPFRWEGRFIVRQEVRWIRIEADPTITPANDIVWNGVLSDITEHKRVERFLREVISKNPMSIQMVDKDGITLEVNSSYKSLFGSVPPSGYSIFNDPQLLQMGMGKFFDQLQHGANVRFPDTYFNAHDSISEFPDVPAWIRTLGFPVNDSKGKPERFVLMHENITERKQAEDALQRSEEKFRQIITCVREGILSLDAEWRITFANAHLGEMFGYGLDELLGQSFELLLHEEDLENFSRRTHEREQGQYSQLECRFRKKDGHEIWAIVSTSPVRDNKGLFAGSFGTITDITERKQAEQMLRESEEHLRSIFRSAPIGIGLVVNRELMRVNSRLCEMTGFDEGELIGQSSRILYPCNEDFEFVGREKYAQIRDHGTGTVETHWQRKDGTLIEILLSSTPIDMWDYSKGVTFTALDITDQKRAEEEKERLQMQLTQAKKMEAIGQLAGGVAHDYNNMLGVIIGYSELILKQMAPSQQFHPELEQIQNAARRSADLTRQLLIFARKQTVAPRLLDLNQTVEGMLKMLRRLIGENIHLVWMPGNGLWPIKMDPSQIDQILVNLCINARDAIKNVGKITIVTENTPFSEVHCEIQAQLIPGEYVRIAVSDTGNGMDKETLAHIFEPFFTTKGVGEGTGLGLATVYGAVKQNNGFINASSEPGLGTTITIYIPRYTNEVIPLVRTATEESITSGTETILLVEDEPMLLEMTNLMLVGQGYQVLAAASPWEAIRLAEEHAGSIDLLMTDVIMPEMNGRELAKQLLIISPNIKRLFMSGYTANIIEPHGVLDEGIHFIQKPFDLKDLVAAIRGALES